MFYVFFVISLGVIFFYERGHCPYWNDFNLFLLSGFE